MEEAKENHNYSIIMFHDYAVRSILVYSLRIALLQCCYILESFLTLGAYLVHFIRYC